MYPHERSLVKKLKDKPFVLIGVNSDKDKKKLKQRMEEENITWRSFWCGPEGTQGPIPSQWNVQGWPTLYVLDAQGKIRYRSYRYKENGQRDYYDDDGNILLRGKSLDKAIETLLAEVEGHKHDHEHGGKAPGHEHGEHKHKHEHEHKGEKKKGEHKHKKGKHK